MKSLVAQIRKVRLQVRGPLTEAAYNGHLETVKLLIERGATLSRKQVFILLLLRRIDILPLPSMVLLLASMKFHSMVQ